MSSYYNKVEGTLQVAKLAQSSDINLIQDNTAYAIKTAIVDMFGPGFILESTEDALKLIPTAIHNDQENLNYDDTKPWISFRERYFRQGLDIEKSSIETIKVHMKNDTEYTVTVYAEIRDSEFDLVTNGEASAKLTPTEDDGYQEINFNFNLHHLPVGHYYFVLRPIDVASISLENTITSTISADDFQVRYDRGGSYSEALEVSYNGSDYLEARLLDEEYEDSDGELISISDSNYDLYFEQVFSSGNTYLITPGTAVINGEKVYPMDTHVTINGPSSTGDRIDLVYLSEDGKLNVLEGTVFVGTIDDDKYPVTSSGFKIAYITTYQSSGASWTCSECGTINDGNINQCINCNHQMPNHKIPLIEQDDDNGITRQRDVIERIRRLEKKVAYQVERNSPTRIKYTCTVDPIIEKKDPNDAEGTYGMTTMTNAKGQNVAVAGGNIKYEKFAWSLINRSYTLETETTDKDNAVLAGWDLHISATKPKNLKTEHYYVASITEKSSKQKTTTQASQPGTVKTVTTTNVGVPNIPVKLKLTKGKKTYINVTKTTNKKGIVYLNIYDVKGIKAGDYTMTASYGSKKVKNKIKIDKKTNFKTTTPQHQTVKITIKTPIEKKTNYSVPNDIIAGDDSFYKENITVDPNKGEAYITKKNNNDNGYTPMSYKKNIEKFYSTTITYKLNNHTHVLDSQYAVLNLHFDRDCYIHTITPHVRVFSNVDKFKIILFENDTFNKKRSSRVSYKKKITGDTVFQNVYKSDYVALNSKNCKVSGSKKTLNKAHTFTVDKRISAGYYSLLILPHLAKGKSEGYVKIKEYATLNHKDLYGTSTKCIGTCQPSHIYLETNNISSNSWFVDIRKRDDEHGTNGTLISKTYNTKLNIRACRVSAHYTLNNGSITTYVSNNGGKTYVNATGGNVNFKSTGNAFRWRLVFHGSNAHSPVLKFHNGDKYAIKFELETSEEPPEYEDYYSCYETPLLNADAITKYQISNAYSGNHFSEWEFARIFLEDEDAINNDDDSRTKVDICISYANNIATHTQTHKDNWSTQIFFSQIFCDLMLKDFSRESVDYDDYNNNVEPDEYNYRFKYQEDYTYNYQTGDIIATPSDVTNINYEDVTFDGHFRLDRTHVNDETVYIGTQETNMFSGMSVKSGPYALTVYEPNLLELDKNAQYYNDEEDIDYDTRTILVGVNFANGLNISDNYTDMTLDIIPVLQGKKTVEEGNVNDIIDLDENGYRQAIIREETVKQDDGTNKTIKVAIPIISANTLEVVVALNPYGLIDDDNATYGKTYTISNNLVSEEHNSFNINLQDDIYALDSVYSIGIRLRNPNQIEDETLIKRINHTFLATLDNPTPTDSEQNAESQEEAQEAIGYKSDGIGLGNIKLGAYNIRSYLPSILTGDTRRWQWKKTSNAKTSYHSIYFQTTSGPWGIYDIGQTDNAQKTTTIVSRSGTNYTTGNGGIATSISGNKIYAGNYQSTINANELVFNFEPNELEDLFYVDTNFPLTGYDLFDIQYYVHGNGQIHKGDIIVEFYDVDSSQYKNASPIEKFPLPAWGLVQYRSVVSDKTVSAWFKTRSNASTIKCIVIRRKNPTGSTVDRLTLHLVNIIGYNTDTMPALGPQMQMRIYPNQMNSLSNTKIRKFGVIYRIT